MSVGQLQVHMENLLPIIKKWLYSDKAIFLRELIANACDAIHKLKVLAEHGEANIETSAMRIDIHIDREKRTLTCSDTGIGMNQKEVEKYICQLAFSGAEEFLTKYQSNKEGDQIIGHFGLGFFSAYMVANKVEIDTLSYRENAIPVHWVSDGSADYTISQGERKERGTTITLHIDKDSEEFLDPAHVRQVLQHYCSFLPYPIYLEDSRINEKPPLWLKGPSQCTEQEYKDFYHQLYPNAQHDPLLWMHLNVDYPFHLKGILYFPKIHRKFDASTSTVQLYCNRVFVSDSCKDVIPDSLMVLQGALDSPDIPLNVSRSHLQMDRTVRQLGQHISKKVTDSLNALYKNDQERYIATWKDTSIIVKLGAAEDEKFYERVKDILIWKTLKGEWLTIEKYQELYRDKLNDKVLYTAHTEHASHLSDMYLEQGLDVLICDGPVDSYLMQVLERRLSGMTFQRIDAGVEEALIDKGREEILLDAEGKTRAGRLADFFRSKLGDSVTVEAKSLASPSVPALITMDEQMRRFREYMRMVNPEDTTAIESLPEKRTLIVNTNNALLTAVMDLDQTHPELAKELAEEIYELSLLGQRELPPQKLSAFIQRSQRVLQQLATLALSG